MESPRGDEPAMTANGAYWFREAQNARNQRDQLREILKTVIEIIVRLEKGESDYLVKIIQEALND